MYQKPDLTEEELVALLGCIQITLQSVIETDDKSFREFFKRKKDLMRAMGTAQKKLMIALDVLPSQNMAVTVNRETGDIRTVIYDKVTSPPGRN